MDNQLEIPDELETPIKLFIKDTVELKTQGNKLIVTNRSITLDNSLYSQVNCFSIKKLVKLLRNYPKEIKEWFNDEDEHNNPYLLAVILFAIIETYDVEVFKIFTSTFLHTSPYVDLHQEDDEDHNHFFCSTHLFQCILDSKDKKIYSYYINNLAEKTHHYNGVIGVYETLITFNHLLGKNDEHYERHIELLKVIESKFKKKDIKKILKKSFVNFSEEMECYIISDNYRCAELIIKYLHKYFDKSLAYGSGIMYAIGYNKLEFYDLLVKWYQKDLSEYDSEEMIEVTPIPLDFDLPSTLLHDENVTKLESLQFLHSKVVKEEFYSKNVIQCLIISTMQSDNASCFAYLITVFPYEAMSMVGHKGYELHGLKNYESYYRQLKELKKEFIECCKN